jgi:hypothetical protein
VALGLDQSRHPRRSRMVMLAFMESGARRFLQLVFARANCLKSVLEQPPYRARLPEVGLQRESAPLILSHFSSWLYPKKANQNWISGKSLVYYAK